MIVLRLVAVLIFSALLTGCPVSEEDIKLLKQAVKELTADIKAAKAVLLPTGCPAPGAPQPELRIPPDDDAKCYYLLTITKVADDGWVRGKVARKALEKNKKDNPGEDIDKYPPSQYGFHVENSQGLDVGKDYEFVGVPGTTDLSCLKIPCVAL